MNLRRILFVELHCVAIAAIAGMLAWRCWYEPGTLRGTPAPRTTAQPRIPPFDAGIASFVAGADAATPKAPPVPAVTKPAASAELAPLVADGSESARSTGPANLLRNGDFRDGLTSWSLWREAQKQPGLLSVVELGGSTGDTPRGYAARIMDPEGVLLGIHQPVSVVSGGVYKLSARVRSLATRDKRVMFGGRVAINLPSQAEYALNWVTEYDQWWPQSLVFTSTTEVVAIVFAHMGYGNARSTGDFTDIRLERLP